MSNTELIRQYNAAAARVAVLRVGTTRWHAAVKEKYRLSDEIMQRRIDLLGEPHMQCVPLPPLPPL